MTLPMNKFPFIPPQVDPDPGAPVVQLPPGVAPGPGPAPHGPFPLPVPPNDNGQPPPWPYYAPPDQQVPPYGRPAPEAPPAPPAPPADGGQPLPAEAPLADAPGVAPTAPATPAASSAARVAVAVEFGGAPGGVFDDGGAGTSGAAASPAARELDERAPGVDEPATPDSTGVDAPATTDSATGGGVATQPRPVTATAIAPANNPIRARFPIAQTHFLAVLACAIDARAGAGVASSSSPVKKVRS